MGTTDNHVKENADDNLTKRHESDNQYKTEMYHDNTSLKIVEENNKFNAGESTKKYTFESGESDKLYGFKYKELDEQRYEFDLNNNLKLGDQKLHEKELEFTHEENMGFLNAMLKNSEATNKFAEIIVGNSNHTVNAVEKQFFPGAGKTKV